MKQIDHNPNEFRKFPDHGDKEFYRKKFGREPRPSDLLTVFLPLLFVAIGMYVLRNGGF